MTGLAGWFGAAVTDENSAFTMLDTMGIALSRGQPRQGVLTRLSDPAASVVASRGLVISEAARVGDVIAAVHGRPRWRNADYEALANQSGWAKSIAEAFARHGGDFLEQLAGWFAVSVFDTAKNTGILAIDRAGIGTLVYGQTDGGVLVFGSTTDAVVSFPGMGGTVSAQAVFNFLFTYTVPSPTTIYEEQKKMLPGQAVEWRQGELRPYFYWEMPYTEKTTAAARELVPALHENLKASFERAATGVSKDDAGAFLSGGLDSSTVAGLLARHYGDGRTFTIGFNEPEFDETGYAKMAWDHFGTSPHVYIPTPDDVLDLIPRMAEIYDEPYGNTSAVPAFCCARMAREAGVTVMFAGDGGDEIFGGNERYAHMQRIEQYGDIPKFLRAGLLEPLLSLPGMSKLPILGKAYSLSKRYGIPMPDRIFSYGFLAETPLDDVLSTELARGVNSEEPLEILREVYSRPNKADLLQRMMHMDLKSALADNDLRKVNRMCALADIEVRYPFLDDELMEFAASVPSSVLLPGAQLRKFYKDAMRGFLPDPILTKTKHGFGLPFAQWIKGHRGLQDLTRSYLADAGRRGYFQPQFISKVEAAAADSALTDLDGFAWDIAVLELWLQRHVDR